MLIPRSRLPASMDEWHGFLRDYFCDKDATAIIEGAEVRLHLEWPSDPQRHVDPNLAEGLAWWDRQTTLGSMWAASWREGRILTALYDTWTLHSWSEWLARSPFPTNDQELVILHVDDHRDLGSPRLVLNAGELLDGITGRSVRLDSPDSVRDAIRSGAIGMGSFMTPFIHAYPKTLVRHLCQPPKAQETTLAELIVTHQPDDLLHPNALRPATELQLLHAGALEVGTYTCTSNAKTWSSGIEGRQALVHIDMDYFNNRYDGDSAWLAREPRLDPDLSSILRKIDELVDALSMSRTKIEDVTIAYSPGFFPAEFWRPADERLRSQLARIL